MRGISLRERGEIILEQCRRGHCIANAFLLGMRPAASCHAGIRFEARESLVEEVDRESCSLFHAGSDRSRSLCGWSFRVVHVEGKTDDEFDRLVRLDDPVDRIEDVIGALVLNHFERLDEAKLGIT